MKTLKHTFTAALALIAATALTLSSCQKEFNAKSYAPPVPPKSYNGYYNSKDIHPGNLVAYWPFSGDLKDSLSSTTGTATGTSFAGGVKGQGLQGANNGYVVSDVPAAIKSLHSFTVSTWVKMPLNANGAVGLISIAENSGFWGTLDIFFDNGGSDTKGVLKVHLFSKATGTTGADGWAGGYSVDKPWGTWIQVAVTYDDTAGVITVYYNGNQVGTVTPTGFAPIDWSGATKMAFGTLQFQTNPSLTTGATAQGWASYLTGVEDQVRFYNIVLSKNEVNALYNLELAGR